MDLPHLPSRGGWQIFTRQAINLANNIFDGKFTYMCRSASKRLAFREFGAHCVKPDEALKEQVSKLIEFWEGHIHQHDRDGLKPISQVMYEAVMIPGVMFI